MKIDNLEKEVRDNLQEGEEFLNFLYKQIQTSAGIEVGLRNILSPAVKKEQRRYTEFQQRYAAWIRNNFRLRRRLLFEDTNKTKPKAELVPLLEGVAKTVENLFDSWEDTVEGHRTAQTDAIKVTIPMLAVIISLISFIISLLR